MRTMHGSSRLHALALCAWLTAACSGNHSPGGGGSGPSEQIVPDAGPDAATRDAAAGRSDGGAEQMRARDAGAKDAAVHTADAGATAHPDAGDAGQNDCPTMCPAPSVCGHEQGAVLCVCPAGYHFVDLGGDKPPCAEDCSDCDGG
jgi:hypothetical protein